MTDKNLLSEIEKIVTLNLPSLQATAFKTYIEEAEKNKKSLTEKCLQIEKWQKDYETVVWKNEEWRKTNQELELLITDQNEFIKNKQQFELDKLKFEIEKKLLLQDIEHYKREASLTTSLFSIAFKNPEFKTSIYKNEGIPIRSQYGEHNFNEIIQTANSTEAISKTVE